LGKGQPDGIWTLNYGKLLDCTIQILVETQILLHHLVLLLYIINHRFSFILLNQNLIIILKPKYK
jgi:hypothetical protein